MIDNDKTNLKNDAPMITEDPSIVIPKMLSLGYGKSMVYHVGNLAHDRGVNTDSSMTVKNIRRISRVALEQAESGQAQLTQRRHVSKNGFPYYEYIMTGAK
jgi:hypothetical protein